MEKNKIIMVGVLLVALISVTAALFYVSTILNRVATSGQNNPVSYDGMAEHVPMKDIQVMGIDDPITTNLISENEKKQHIIRLTASVGINSKSKEAKKLVPQIEEQKVVIRDAIIEILTTKTFEEMVRPDAHHVLKEEILETLRQGFQTSAIVEVYLGEFIIQ